MRVSAVAVSALLATPANAFVVPSFARRPVSSCTLKAANLHEFDYLLQEGGDNVVQNAVQKTTRRRVVMPGSPDDTRAIQMTSSATFEPSSDEFDSTLEQEVEEDDEYADIYSEQLNKIKEYDQEKTGFNLNQFLKESDFGDIVVTLAIPGIIAFVAIRFASGKVYTALEGRADKTLDSFASEMIYHDGDFEEMRMCKDDYSRRLVWLGPKRSDAMLKRYLQTFAKKKTVSPQSIRYGTTTVHTDDSQSFASSSPHMFFCG